jgi:hypothetical protein
MAPIFVGGRRILGALSADPTTGLLEGDEYYNTTSKKTRFYNGTAWGDIGSSGSSLSFSVTDKWGFESNSLLSTGTSGSTITNNGATFSSTAKTGTTALSFDGSNDYATFPGGASTTIITIAFWIYWRGHNSNGRTYLTDFRGTDGSAGYWLLDSNNTMTFSINGATESTQSFTPADNVWEHYAFVSSSGGSARIYRNGSEIITVTSSGANVNGTMVIGTFSGATGGSGNYFMNAIIDNYVFHRGALTSQQISELYTSTSNFA